MIAPPKCFERKCLYYQGVLQSDGTEIGERHYCYAYPEGIPEDIVDGTDLHAAVRSDQDNETVYMKKEDE